MALRLVKHKDNFTFLPYERRELREREREGEKGTMIEDNGMKENIPQVKGFFSVSSYNF
jgi:hypothetical protein